jgi:hypothetical protein
VGTDYLTNEQGGYDQMFHSGVLFESRKILQKEVRKWSCERIDPENKRANRCSCLIAIRKIGF